MFVNKLGLMYGENDARNIDVMRNQNMKLDRLPIQSDFDADNATKYGFLNGYQDLTGGDVYYNYKTHPVENPIFKSKFVRVDVEVPVGPDIKSIITIPYDNTQDNTPEYIQSMNIYRSDIMSSIISKLNQTSSF